MKTHTKSWGGKIPKKQFEICKKKNIKYIKFIILGQDHLKGEGHLEDNDTKIREEQKTNETVFQCMKLRDFLIVRTESE